MGAHIVTDAEIEELRTIAADACSQVLRVRRLLDEYRGRCRCRDIRSALYLAPDEVSSADAVEMWRRQFPTVAR